MPPNKAKKAAVLAITEIASLAASPSRIVLRQTSSTPRLGPPPFLPLPTARAPAECASKMGKYWPMMRNVAKPAAHDGKRHRHLAPLGNVMRAADPASRPVIPTFSRLATKPNTTMTAQA